MNIAFGGAGVEPELARIINAAYDTGERDIWQPGWQRVSVDRVRELVAAGEIAVAWAGDVPIGCARIHRLVDDAAMFGMLSVDPAAHGTGLGRALIAFAEAAFDVSEMELELLIPRGAPHPSKVRLHDWYTRLGYRQIGRRAFDEPDLVGPADLFVYRKNLRAVPATDAPPRAET
jgi:GNAT superfamily N-acetyltransferase